MPAPRLGLLAPWAPLALCGAVIAGCVADPIPGAPGWPGADLGRWDAGPDGGPRAPRDAAEPDGPPLDAAPDAAPDPDAAPPDAEVDAEPYAGPPVDPPAPGLVALAERGGDTFFVWLDPAGRVVSLRVDADGRAVGDPVEVDAPAQPPEGIVARAVGGHPWVAHGGGQGPVVLFQVDLPARTRLAFDDMIGPPLIAPAGDGVLVVGRTEAGALAWRRVGNDLDVGPLVVDDLGLPLPDAASDVPAGVVLVYDGPGQCVQLGDLDWRAIGTFVCPGGRARVLSSASRALLARIAAFGADQHVGVRDLYDRDHGEYRVVFLETEAGLRFPLDGARWPVVGGRVIDGVRQLVASVIGPDDVYDSAERWGSTADWPFDRTRALALRSLPALARDGACAHDGAPCRTAGDCGGAICEGAVAAEHLLALDFRLDGRPRIRRYPTVRRGVGVPAYGLSDQRGCLPRPERCDLVDQDCDGRLDDGRCCEAPADLSYRWQSLLPVARAEGPGRRYDILFADVQSTNAYRLMYRYAGTDRWEGRVVPIRQDPSGVPSNLGIGFEGAIDGRFLVAAGGVTGLVARRALEGGGVGGWTLFLGHPGRRDPDTFPPRPQVPLDCDEVLAADALNHLSPNIGNPDGEQIVVVCDDRLLRIYAVHEGRDQVYRLDGRVPALGWATITRTDEHALTVLAGVPVPAEGVWALRQYDFDGDAPDPPVERVPQGALAALAPLDAAAPIWPHPVPGRAPIQIRGGTRARLAFETTDARGRPQVDWRDVVTGRPPAHMVYSPREFRLYAAAPVEPPEGLAAATAWWVINITGNRNTYDLWSIDPVFTVEADVGAWFATGGSYGFDDPGVDAGRYDLVVVFPSDETDTRWRLVTRETRCQPP